MKQIAMFAITALLLAPSLLSAQGQAVTGTIKNGATQEPASAVSVSIKGSTVGTYTNDNGNFRLPLPANAKFPLTLVITSIGFEMKEVQVASASQPSAIQLSPSSALGEEVVVSATRTPTRILESPVSIERISSSAIRNSATTNYYDMVTNLKGIDMVAASLTFKTVTTRGFAGSGNTRFNQIVDGMDNQAPGLNFSVGSVIGLSELDVESMELLQGASSALYGPGGMNGTLLINSKSPFKHQGLSFQMKEGMMHMDNRYRDPSGYHNWAIRYAKKIGDKFAFKINTELIQAKDWLAADYRNVNRNNRTTSNTIPGTRGTDPNYDGVSVYGDETTIDLRQVLNGIAGQAPFLAPYISTLTGSPMNVSRTGYTEREVVDPNTINFKLGGAFHYKISNNLEAIAEGFWGTGNSVYTGSDRYALKDLKMGQYKLELQSKNWFLRGYTTQENSGQAYNATIATRLFNEGWKISPQWYTEYGQAFLGAKLNGLTDIDAHKAARNVADVGRPLAGSARFNRIYDSVRLRPISKGGGLFVDRTNLYAVEGQYNFSHLTGDFADILVGGNYRRFLLNSQGTLFADSSGAIPISEYGGYVQVSKPIMNDKVKLTVSGRYDKNENFKGRFTPRATATIKLAKDHNLRFSYQQAYRFPSTQNQFINLAVGGATLIGGVPAMLNFYNFKGNPVYSLDALLSPSPQLKVQSFQDFKPESVTSYEIGYRGLMADKRLLIDLYAYYGQYKDFITSVNVVQSVMPTPSPTDVLVASRRRILQVPINSPTQVKTQGAGISLDYNLNKGYYANVNASYDELGDVPNGYITNFNAPNYRFNATIGNSGMGKAKKVGFSLAYRWQDEFFYTSSLANGFVPAYHNLDAQVTYKFPEIKSIIRFGATNLLNDYYITAIANPSIGGVYYVAFAYNIY
ncbi:MAG: TonB-dependent receptor [Bacteroidetes bacterium]|nr:TonB-dependent receptor [Bacteroidota bacterium]